jgi:hypothetical protein
MARTSKAGKASQRVKHQNKPKARKSVRKQGMAARTAPRGQHDVQGSPSNGTERATHEAMVRNETDLSIDELANRGHDQKVPVSFGAQTDGQFSEPAHQESQLSSLRQAQICWEAAGLALKGFQTLALLSHQNLRAWQETWLALARLNR